MWMNYIEGGLNNYPELIMNHNINQVYERLVKIYTDDEPPENYSDAYLQARNPVTVEGLVQLTMGGPMPLYNGGLLNVSVCYYDIEKKRIGLPDDVAALISHIDVYGINLILINLNPVNTRRFYIQAGAFGEHNFSSALIDENEIQIDNNRVEVELKPVGIIKMRLIMERYKNKPAYQWPF